MASVNGVSSSNQSTLYGNRNIISGLASNMDTESMIENSVKGIRLKISTLQQQQTKLSWKQEGMQSITDKLVQFSRKYTSYTSSTNLLSASFFNKSVTTTTSGANASKVSATGRSSSDLQVNGVAQLASSSRYEVSSGGVLDGVTADTIQAGSSINLSGLTTISNLSGGLTLNYGEKSVSVSFTDSEKYKDVQEFANAINLKLADQNITFSSGTTKKASEVILASVVDNKITFTDKEAGGNSVYIKDVSGRLKETFAGADFSAEAKNPTLDLSGKSFTRDVNTMELIGGKTMSFTLDGSTKNITIPTAAEVTLKGGSQDVAFTALLKEKLDTSFGVGKITVSDENVADNALQLSFKVGKGSSLGLSSAVGTTLGLENNQGTYLNTSKTLGELIAGFDSKPGATLLKAEGKVTAKDGTYSDAKGNLVNAAGDRLGKDGKPLYGHALNINGQVIGTYHRDSALETVMQSINGNTAAGLSLSYSKTTNAFVFTAKDTGAGHSISFGGTLAESIFGVFDQAKADANTGKDAIVNMTVNGAPLTLTRSSNTFDVDGMSVTVSGTFNNLDADGKPVLDADGKPTVVASPKDPVSFKTTADADKIVEAIKSMVQDYNTMITETYSGFYTLPAQKANHTKYQPLTESDRESMTETAIKNYEEKAKQGVLFGDQDLSAMYGKLISAITPAGSDAQTLRSIGLSTDYSQGITTLSLDETKLRDMLKTNPDTVRDAFTKVSGEGSSTNGLMKNFKATLDTYASVEGTKGILINKAGSKYSTSTLLQNSVKSEMDGLDTQVEKWQDKLSTKVDYYTRQFTRLEQLISKMNSQSSSISGMMGG